MDDPNKDTYGEHYKLDRSDIDAEMALPCTLKCESYYAGDHRPLCKASNRPAVASLLRAAYGEIAKLKADCDMWIADSAKQNNAFGRAAALLRARDAEIAQFIANWKSAIDYATRLEVQLAAAKECEQVQFVAGLEAAKEIVKCDFEARFPELWNWYVYGGAEMSTEDMIVKAIQRVIDVARKPQAPELNTDKMLESVQDALHKPRRRGRHD